MKAKTIYETLNFERGLDPKQAMGIGEGLYFVTLGIGCFNLYYSGLNQIMMVRLHDEEMSLDRYLKKYNITTKTMGGTRRSPIIKYIGLKHNLITMLRELYEKDVDDNGIEDYGAIRVQALTKVEEAQHFTRGLDPKDAMDTGQKMLDRKLIDEIDWSVHIDTIKHLYDIIEFIRDYKGFPILIVKEKGRETDSWPFKGISRKYRPMADVKKIASEFCDSAERALLEIKHKIDVLIDHKYLIETQNFTRGLDPKDAMGTGDLEYRKKEEEFLEIIKNVRILTGLSMDSEKYVLCKNWHGDEVRIMGIDRNRNLFGFNYYDDWEWRYCSWGYEWGKRAHETSHEQQETWMDIDKSDAEKAFNKFKKSSNRANDQTRP